MEGEVSTPTVPKHLLTTLEGMPVEFNKIFTMRGV
jgi:hypothetical protein